jgi:hypothetical protein
MKLKVFADLHHGDLYFSLHRLFVERLGCEIYRPIGFDWFHKGFWKIAEPYGNAMDTVGQYLDIEHEKWEQKEELIYDEYVYKIHGNSFKVNEVHFIYEPVHDYYQKAITLETFKNMKFDIVLSTIQSHDLPYQRLRDSYQPQAKIIAHLGNTGQKSPLPNIIHSVPYIKRPEQNAVLAHQELDPRLYNYIEPPKNTKSIFSVVNCYPYPKIYETYKNLLKEVEMKNYGAGCPDGSLFGSKGVAERMREANAGWHLKPQGGLGHSAMGWMFSGRPIITNMSQHRSWGGNAVKLFEPGVTCHDIEAHTVEENCKLIRKMLEPEENAKWCERAKKRFHEIIDYDKEEQDVRDFLSRLI